ncbi:hypothetical protein L6172_00780 [Thalassospiraceae bacterium SW-3-3]|nr:hypothetical protein L6172_00780 [Thalassospiraceae bacterium SW-3-3]
MAKIPKHRAFASIALLRLSEREIRDLHQTICDMSPSMFLNNIKDIEDEVDSALSAFIGSHYDNEMFNDRNQSLYKEINYIRRQELGIPVRDFVDLMVDAVRRVLGGNIDVVPSFDSRRGLQAWVDKLINYYGEPTVFRALSLIRDKTGKNGKADWLLR